VGGKRDGQKLIDAASTIRTDLAAIGSALDDIGRRRLLPPGVRDDVREVEDRVRRCADLLGAELDRPTPNRRFLRLAVGLGRVAASAALGIGAGEMSEHVDFRVPFTIVRDHAESAEQAAAQVDEDDLPPSAEWDWTVLEGDLDVWRSHMAGVGSRDMLSHSLTRFDDDEGVVVTLNWLSADKTTEEEIQLSWDGYAANWPNADIVRTALQFSMGFTPAGDEQHLRSFSRALDLLERR
jgi:hypothetical protein